MTRQNDLTDLNPMAAPAWQLPTQAQLWLDDRLRLMDANAAGRRVLARHADLLAVEAGVLQVRTAAPQWPAALALARCGQRAAVALPTPHRPLLSLLILPQVATLPPGHLLLLCRAQALQQLDVAITRQLFDLTAREAEVVAALAEGQATAAIATKLGVQTNTVQAHLKSAMAKIGVSRQAQLVAMLWRSVAALPADLAPHPPAAGGAPVPRPELACMGKDAG
jgi:DNA-binding CsgD family transcriptional regulator